MVSSVYLAEGIAADDSSERHEWKHQAFGTSKTSSCTPKHAKHARIPTLTDKHPSWVTMNDVTGLFTGNGSNLAIIIQMKD